MNEINKETPEIEITDRKVSSSGSAVECGIDRGSKEGDERDEARTTRSRKKDGRK
jgi:hypothetical protein